MNIQWLNDESIKDIAGGGVVASNDQIFVSVDAAPRDIIPKTLPSLDLAPPDGVTVSRPASLQD